jgi:hypothetical protein
VILRTIRNITLTIEPLRKEEDCLILSAKIDGVTETLIGENSLIINNDDHACILSAQISQDSAWVMTILKSSF